MPLCPALVPASGAVWVDTLCAADPCRATLAQESGCFLRLHTEGCGLDEIQGEVQPDGNVAFAPSNLGRCTSRPAPSGSILSASCALTGSTCSLTVYPMTEPAMAVARVLPLADVPLADVGTNPDTALDGLSMYRGYLGGAAVQGSDLAVISQAPAIATEGCTGRETPVIEVLDTRSEQVRSATAPPCLSVLAPDPTASGYLGLYYEGAHRIGRFSADGRLLASRPLVGPGLDATQIAITLLAAQGRAIAIFTPMGLVLSIDATTLEVRATDGPRTASFRSGSFGQGRLVVADTGVEWLRYFDPLTLLEARGIDLPNEIWSNNPGSTYTHEPSGSLLFSTLGPHPATGVARGDSFLYTTFYERVAAGWAMVTWPADPSLVLIGLTDNAQAGAARAGLFDPNGRRHLPGSVPLGAGAVRDMFAIDGAVWATLPWEAKLVKITAR